MIEFSVIIPLYNKESTIVRAINSVLQQTVQPNEIVIINDGSTDNSIDKVDSFQDSRIRVINQKNEGVSGARNKGISVSICEYLTFLDADDEWLPDFLFTIKKLIKEFPNAVGYGTAYFKKFNFQNQVPCKLDRLRFNSTEGLIKNYFEVCNYSDPPIWTSAVCVKKDIFNKIGGFPIGVKAGEDILTWARASLFGNFAYSTLPLALYYQPVLNNELKPPSKEDVVGKELKKMFYENSHLACRKDLKRYIGKWHKMRAALFLITGEKICALHEIIKSIMYQGFSIKLLIYSFLVVLPKKTRYKILFPNHTVVKS